MLRLLGLLSEYRRLWPAYIRLCCQGVHKGCFWGVKVHLEVFR